MFVLSHAMYSLGGDLSDKESLMFLLKFLKIESVGPKDCKKVEQNLAPAQYLGVFIRTFLYSKSVKIPMLRWLSGAFPSVSRLIPLHCKSEYG